MSPSHKGKADDINAANTAIPLRRFESVSLVSHRDGLRAARSAGASCSNTTPYTPVPAYAQVRPTFRPIRVPIICGSPAWLSAINLGLDTQRRTTP